MGKAYANRKPIEQRPDADFYSTPFSLTRELMKLIDIPKQSTFYEPCAGNGAITKVLKEHDYNVIEDDIRTTKKDFLDYDGKVPYLITNPPFSLFDDIVLKAQQITEKQYIILLKTNFFGAYKRNELGVWKHLKELHIFNRQVDYRTPLREDGHFHVGNLITGWGIFDKSWNESWWKTSIVDIQQYATLGGIK